MQLSDAFYDTHIDSIEKYVSRASDRARKLNYAKGDAWCRIIEAQIAYEQHDFVKCRANCLAAIEIGKELNDKIIEGRGYYHIGWSYHAEDKYPEAIENLYMAVRRYEEVKDSMLMFHTLAVVGANYADYGNDEEGLKICLDALQLQERFNNKRLLIYNYYVVAGISSSLRRYEEALKYNRKLEQLSIEIGDQRRLQYSYINYANIYLNQYKEFANNKEVSQAKLLLAGVNASEAQKLFEQIGNNYTGVNSTILLGQVNFHKKDFEKARYFLNKCLQLALKIKDKFETRDSYYWLAKNDSAQGNFRNAFEMYKNYIVYRDSVVNEESTRKNTQLKLQYEFDKKEDSLKQKQIITQTQLNAQKKQKIFYLAGAGLLALLSLFVYLNFRNQKKINRLAGDAHAKEKAELELQSLRAQLNPHFMFNSLNAIQELILLEENEKSQSYLARFAKLLRLLLENADKPFIALQRELDFLQLYLSLENLRIPDLQFSINVDHNINTETTQIPNMILQPYIENAIWHGLSHKQGDRKLQIRISRENGFTKYEIEDNGVGRKKSAELKSPYRKEHKSKGMELLSKRFKLLAKECGSDIETRITDVMNSGEVSGTLVTIKVPIEFSSGNKSHLNTINQA